MRTDRVVGAGGGLGGGRTDYDASSGARAVGSPAADLTTTPAMGLIGLDNELDWARSAFLFFKSINRGGQCNHLCRSGLM